MMRVKRTLRRSCVVVNRNPNVRLWRSLVGVW